MEIRILRAADVHALLPMAECIDLMHRTMSAVSEGRVVLPLRSVMVMPATGHDGQYARIPGRSRVLRREADQPHAPQQADRSIPRISASCCCSRSSTASRSRCWTRRKSLRSVPRPPAAWRPGCWRNRCLDLAMLGAGEQASSHLAPCSAYENYAASGCGLGMLARRRNSPETEDARTRHDRGCCLLHRGKP